MISYVMSPAWRAIALHLLFGSISTGFTLATTAGCVPPPPATLPPDSALHDTEAHNSIVVWPAGRVAALYPVDEVRAFRYLQHGQVIGFSYGRYAGPVPASIAHGRSAALGRPPSLHRFETRIELNIPGRLPVRSTGEVMVDDTGELIRGFERSNAAELTFSVNDGTFMISDGAEQESLSFAAGTAFMAYMATLHEELMFAQRELRTGEQRWKMVSLSGGTPREWVGEVSYEDGEVTIATNLGERVILRDRRILRIEVEDDALVIEPIEPAPTWPTWEVRGPQTLRYTPPKDASFKVRRIRLPGRSDQPELAGEVLLPNATRPAPVAVYLSASGRGDRYGFAGPPWVDLGAHAITDALAEAGFVVVRFDNPGFGDSTDRLPSWTAQIEDARRALRTAVVQPEADPNQVVLVGHGEGGWKAMRLAAQYRDLVRGVALLGTPGRPYREILRDRAQVYREQLPASLQAEADREHEKMMHELESGAQVPPEFEARAQWIREVLREDPAKLVAAVHCPIWVAQGGRDFETDPQAAVAGLVHAAKRNGKAMDVATYPELDHLFKVESGRSMPARYLTPRPVDERFIASLVAWARKTVAQ
ncbi:MAG: alpha/beta fold hydrolase [Nannocystaceae bacterium]